MQSVMKVQRNNLNNKIKLYDLNCMIKLHISMLPFFPPKYYISPLKYFQFSSGIPSTDHLQYTCSPR